MRKLSLVVLCALGALLTTTPAGALGGVVSPNSAVPGGTITVTGTVPVPGCPARGNVIVQGISLWATPSGYVAAPYGATGHFSVSGMLSSTLAVGSHAFLIRCASPGEPLGPAAGGEIGGPAASATFTVIGLASTGGALGPLSDRAAIALALALVVIGGASMFAARCRRDSISV